MPALSNLKHEEFCQHRAAGMAMLEAYVAAGYTASASAASQVAKRPEVQNRIMELQQERASAERNAARDAVDAEGEEDINLEWAVRELKKNVKSARDAGNVSAANKAIEMLIDIKGLSARKGKTAPPPPANEPPTDPDHGGEGFDAILDKLGEIADLAAEAEPEVDWDAVADEVGAAP